MMVSQSAPGQDHCCFWEGNGRDGASATANWLQNMARTLPPMMQVMKDIGGVEIPEVLASLGRQEREGRQPKSPVPVSDGTRADGK